MGTTSRTTTCRTPFITGCPRLATCTTSLAIHHFATVTHVHSPTHLRIQRPTTCATTDGSSCTFYSFCSLTLRIGNSTTLLLRRTATTGYASISSPSRPSHPFTKPLASLHVSATTTFSPPTHTVVAQLSALLGDVWLSLTTVGHRFGSSKRSGTGTAFWRSIRWFTPVPYHKPVWFMTGAATSSCVTYATTTG